MADQFKLENVLPWGRVEREYAAFFTLDDAPLDTRILDCAGGPSSFNAERTARGGRVTSVDPLFQFPGGAIEARVHETRDAMLAGLRAERHRFILTGTIEDHEALRLSATRGFLADFEAGKAEGRYVSGALPDLGFDGGAFDLALCSHFLFLYSDHLDEAFHRDAISEMMRVAGEARIFPLLDLAGAPSVHVAPVRAALEDSGLTTSVERVAYEFQKGGDEMLRVRRAA
jgi:hypothetical protein